MKNFLLLDDENKVVAKFKNKYPRQAALKAANMGFQTIRLLERGTKGTKDDSLKKQGWKVHVFTGERTKIPKPAGAPAWMAAEVYKPNVIKIGIVRLLKISV